jgi:hypothetical protein
MGTTLEGTEVAREESAGKLDVTVVMSRLAFEALVDGETGSGENEAPVRMESALRCYLGDRGTDRPAWPYPGFLRGSETQRDVRVDFEVGEDLWRNFEEEAAAQSVSVEQLAEHAVFYFAAELDAGRLTQRILDDLTSSKGEGET